jgi:hypothetical protein
MHNHTTQATVSTDHNHTKLINMPQLTYKCNSFTTTNAAIERPEYSDVVTINCIKYRVVSVTDSTVYLELYGFPTTLSHYLLMLQHLDECQYQQWYSSLSLQQRLTVVRRNALASVANRGLQISAYKVSYDGGTLVYYHQGAWHAVNNELQATAKAATIAELLNYWAEATEHVHYDLLD